MLSGGNRATSSKFRVQDEGLTLRPYNQALGQLTASVCQEVGMAEQDVCLFEARTAFDCLLRRKVSKLGDITDNEGACKHHIANMKAALGHPEYLDKKLRELNYMPRSFV